MTLMTVNAMTVGERLRASRLLAGIDQTEMGRIVGASRPTVSNWERGITEPTVSQFLRWAEATKQPADQMIDGLVCTPWDLNPEPTDSEFWSIVASWPDAPVAPAIVGGVRP
jgi:transcriptional regulator with XRE-family HTH domain